MKSDGSYAPPTHDLIPVRTLQKAVEAAILRVDSVARELGFSSEQGWETLLGLTTSFLVRITTV